MNKKILWFFGIFIALYILMQLISGFYLDFEWFKSQESLSIFRTLVLTKFNVVGVFSLVFIIMFFLNFLLMIILGGKGRIFANNIFDRIRMPVFGSTRRALYVSIIIITLFLAFIMGSAGGSYWKEYLMYSNSVPFGGFPLDPVFNKDIGFYVFSLPFYKFTYGWIMASLVIIVIFSVIFHVVNGGILLYNNKLEFSLFSRAHLSTLISMIIILYGIGYRLSAYGLLFTQRGKFYGAGYTAVNAELPAYNVCMILSFIAAALLLYNIYKKSFKLPIVVLISLISAYIILGTIYPSIQQRFFVEPNELDLEKTYIENNIKFTRIAYGIENVKQKEFANKSDLNYRDILKNKDTLNNIRIWDWRPLQQTYKQLQELKPYYQFHDVDVDRYLIDGIKTTVNVSARELAIDKLAKNSRTWINTHLVYTHGYGFVLSRVDKATSEGLPEMLIYDIPPKSKLPVEINEPRIYFGEYDNPYAITSSISPGEFDYPYGEVNKYNRYKGTGGTRVDSFARRLFFSIALKDMNILISTNINKDSRILYYRTISEMVRKLTPFLEFDEDPYMVFADGRIFWLIDAYTTTGRFPYSTPVRTSMGDINYIRNSVKIVIDAYNGNMDYYIADDKDPVIKTYSNIFPGLFKDISGMPEYLKSHLRYPEDIFTIQSNILLRYHMTNTNVFYNNEDVWDIPRQVYQNSEEPIQNYYLVTKLPGETESEFITIIPFTPIKKDNMIGFLTAKCDPQSYGELILYTLPKDKLSYGPMQIEARINQDPEISQQLALWNQQGSNVIRGNMLVIPVEESLLFIEPLYLKASRGEIPELKRVIVSFSDKIIMEENLKTALEKIFLHGRVISEEISGEKNIELKIKDYAEKAYMHFQQAEEYQRNGNWAGYGEELKQLKEILRAMKEIKK